MNYLEAHPGIRQTIGSKLYTIKWMFATRKDAAGKVEDVKATGEWGDVRMYVRTKYGHKFGKHPYCVAVRGRK